MRPELKTNDYKFGIQLASLASFAFLIAALYPHELVAKLFTVAGASLMFIASTNVLFAFVPWFEHNIREHLTPFILGFFMIGLLTLFLGSILLLIRIFP